MSKLLAGHDRCCEACQARQHQSCCRLLWPIGRRVDPDADSRLQGAADTESKEEDSEEAKSEDDGDDEGEEEEEEEEDEEEVVDPKEKLEEGSYDPTTLGDGRLAHHCRRDRS